MLDSQRFFTNFTDLVKRFGYRGITHDRLLFIKEKLIKQKELTGLINQLRWERNQLEGPGNAQKIKEVKKKIATSEKELEKLSQELNDLTNQLPNLPALNTPTNQESNRIIDNTEYQHNIQHNLTHEEIIKKLALIDEEKSILLSGSKFAVYQGFGSQLLHALINFLLVENSKQGYQLFDTPYLVNDYNLYHTGQLPKFQADSYKIENSNFYLIPT